ncbi:hypothetical protein [Treponema sp.]|uniref:hypothetical protein n=1 Tax=Treponema sp. TaxID=166 RepID=UPI00298E3A7C|nr:hypothetical protein [Treponema sp.]
MDEQKLRDIEPPKKGEITPKQKRINTFIFMFVGALFNLVITFGFGIGFMLLIWFVINKMNPAFSKDSLVTPIMWVSVIGAIAVSFNLQKIVFRAVIKGFKLQDKLEKDFLDRYVKEK